LGKAAEVSIVVLRDGKRRGGCKDCQWIRMYNKGPKGALYLGNRRKVEFPEKKKGESEALER